MIDPALYDCARDRIAATGFTPDIQSKIALVLSAAKNGNLMFHANLQWMPNLGVVQQFFISQAAHELEAVTLLACTTKWSADPALAMEANRIVAPLLSAWGQIMLPPGPVVNPQAAYRGISLGHAQLARIRLLPVIPENADPLDPFVVALGRIEQENGAACCKPKSACCKTSARRCRSPNAKPWSSRTVDGVFSEFLAWLAAP